jgi:hypothetical protein
MSITPSTPSLPPKDSSGTPAEAELPVIPQPDAMAHIGQEYGSGKENLPPAKLVGIILGVLVVTLAVLAFVFRAKSPAVGAIDDIQLVEVPEQNSVMLAINVSFQNNGKTEYKMRSISAELETANGTYEDHPAAAMDFDRYLDAFPQLKNNAMPRLEIQTVEPGGRRTGRVIVSFPVTAADFANRKSLKVKVSAFGESVPLEMTK